MVETDESATGQALARSPFHWLSAHPKGKQSPQLPVSCPGPASSILSLTSSVIFGKLLTLSGLQLSFGGLQDPLQVQVPSADSGRPILTLRAVVMITALQTGYKGLRLLLGSLPNRVGDYQSMGVMDSDFNVL